MREKGLRLADEEESPLLAENKQFLKLPPPYSQTADGKTEEENKPAASTLPPTMMEKLDDKSSKPAAGGQE